jgi:hypothetical protein
MSLLIVDVGWSYGKGRSGNAGGYIFNRVAISPKSNFMQDIANPSCYLLLTMALVLPDLTTFVFIMVIVLLYSRVRPLARITDQYLTAVLIARSLP